MCIVRILVIIFISLACSQRISAQMDSLLFRDNHRIDTAGVGELRFNLDGISFFRDNEYEGNLTKGYSLPGFWLQPTVSFQPIKRLRIEAGAYMLHYWGANKYPNLNYSDLPQWKGEQTQQGFHVLPYFQAHLAISDNFNIVLGNLYGKNNHHLIEPLYNQEMGLSSDPEAGLQFLWDAPAVNLDTWINWESFIFDTDQHQESFTYGLSARFKTNRPKAWAHVYFPVQILMQHRGGEVNTEAETREVRTWLNAAAGIGFDINPHNDILRNINVECTGAYFKQMAGTMLPFNNGYGVFTKVSLDLWRFKVEGAYWCCNDFISILGNPLFGAMSINDDSYTVEKPRLILARIKYGHDLGYGFSLGLHADAYNNLSADANITGGESYREKAKMSLAFGIYLRINPTYLIKRFKMK